MRRRRPRTASPPRGRRTRGSEEGGGPGGAGGARLPALRRHGPHAVVGAYVAQPALGGDADERLRKAVRERLVHLTSDRAQEHDLGPRQRVLDGEIAGGGGEDGGAQPQAAGQEGGVGDGAAQAPGRRVVALAGGEVLYGVPDDQELGRHQRERRGGG